VKSGFQDCPSKITVDSNVTCSMLFLMSPAPKLRRFKWSSKDTKTSKVSEINNSYEFIPRISIIIFYANLTLRDTETILRRNLIHQEPDHPGTFIYENGPSDDHDTNGKGKNSYLVFHLDSIVYWKYPLCSSQLADKNIH
jgi:hypothetical protein